jgi:hypothetical protein
MCHVDEAGLVRRLGFSVDILGGGPAIHCPTEQQGFGGILVRPRRRVCVRNPDGSPICDPALVATDITNLTVSWEHCMCADIAPSGSSGGNG